MDIPHLFGGFYGYFLFLYFVVANNNVNGFKTLVRWLNIIHK